MEAGIKFHCHWQTQPIGYPSELATLNHWRSQLLARNLIGVSDGIGFGNISLRIDTSEAFLISATSTGSLSVLTERDVSLVYRYDLKENEIWCKGEARASSESPSHAAIYQVSSEYAAVVHVHHKELWLRGREQWPTSDAHATYGSPEMAVSIQELLRSGRGSSRLPIVMGGHQDGLLAFGEDLASAAGVILDALSSLE